MRVLTVKGALAALSLSKMESAAAAASVAWTAAAIRAWTLESFEETCDEASDSMSEAPPETSHYATEK
jgi:hypothetical protein